MSNTDTANAKLYANQAQVAAAQAKIYAQAGTNASQAAAEAQNYANQAENSSSTAELYSNISATEAQSSSLSAEAAALSAEEALSAVVDTVKQQITFTTGGTLNSALDRISDGTYLYYWTGTFPKIVPPSSTVDSTGGQVTGAWACDTALPLSQGLAASNGLALVGQCQTMSAMRSTLFSFVGQQIFLREHTAGQAAGGGIFYCHSLTSDGSYVDDNGCQIINNYGQVIRRKDIYNIYSSMFGLVSGGDIIECCNNMFKASRTFSLEDVYICKPPYGGYYIGNSGSDGSTGFVADCSDGMSFRLHGLGVGINGPAIYHKGDGVLFRIRRNHANSQNFWIAGEFDTLRIFGRSDDLSTTNNYTRATSLEASDFWESTFKNIFISGYTGNSSGSAISLYNETAWTERAIFDRVNIRQSVVGLRLHKNTTPGNSSTNSFFALEGTIEINAGVGGTAITYMVIGDGSSAGACFLYGHDLKIIGWMSNGSWHNGIFVSDYSTVFNGKFTLCWDGYGISSGSSTEVIHLLRVGGVNARIDCDVVNYSGQSNSYPLSMITLIANTCVYLDDPNVFNGTLTAAYPILRPKGLIMKFKGTFTQAQCISGLSYTLSGLTPGLNLRVKLSSWNNNSKYETVTQTWSVEVRGTDFPCIVKPYISSGSTLATTSDTVNNTSGTAISVLKTATLTSSQVINNSTYGNSLTITNGQTSNAISYAANSGRKIVFSLPANAAATQDMPYQVEIEIM